MFLKISHNSTARNFQGRPEGKHECAEQAKSKRRRQNCGVWAAQPHNVERHQLAHRGNQQIRRPKSKNESTCTAEYRQRETFSEKLANNAPTSAAERETYRDFFATRCA